MRTVSSWIPLTHVIRSVQEPCRDIGSATDHLLVSGLLLVGATTSWLALAARVAD